MEETPAGTPVGVDDPYEHAGRCDHVTEDGRCRFAIKQSHVDPSFAAARRDEELACPVAAGNWSWQDCQHFQCTTDSHECHRCGLRERRRAHDGSVPLLEEHHLSYSDSTEANHEVTVTLCRWCHAKVHDSFARIDDDASPDPEALAAREARRSDELAELEFETAAERSDKNF
jgi:hypothetical protein